MKKKLSSKQNPVRSQSEEISYASSYVSKAKTSFFPPSKQNLVCESALLVPQVKLRLDDKSDRCGHVSNCHIGSIVSFHTLGLPTINTPPPPSFVGAGWRETLILLVESFPRKIPKQNQKAFHRNLSPIDLS